MKLDLGHAMAQAVSDWHARVSSYGICDGLNGAGTCFSVSS